jgi:CheY-like chemotaxis protein/anti-sigma regulatory factor (Ser/Thr protein kinase)
MIVSVDQGLADSTVVPETSGPRSPPTTVLIVDDSLVDRRKAGGLVEDTLAWRVIYADNGKTAMEAIERHRPDLVLTDLQMPEMNGLELAIAVRGKYPHLPVVLMTAYGSEAIAVQALRGGASSYVPKRSMARDLAETLDQVLATARADLHHQRLVESLQHLESWFVLENEPGLVRALVVMVKKHLTDMRLGTESRRMRVGLALEEALNNALYHGNLDVSSELRQQGDGKAFYLLAEERRRQAPFRDRRIHVHMKLCRTEGIYVVRDEGAGFDPNNLPDPTDPANMERASGRGLLLIRTFMDDVVFNEPGNEITMRMRHEASGEE